MEPVVNRHRGAPDSESAQRKCVDNNSDCRRTCALLSGSYRRCSPQGRSAVVAGNDCALVRRSIRNGDKRFRVVNSVRQSETTGCFRSVGYGRCSGGHWERGGLFPCSVLDAVNQTDHSNRSPYFTKFAHEPHWEFNPDPDKETESNRCKANQLRRSANPAIPWTVKAICAGTSTRKRVSSSPMSATCPSSG